MSGDLYAPELVEHGNTPRNHRKLSRADISAHKSNPSCGDELRVSVVLKGDRLSDVAFEGDGCLVCLASASMMTVLVSGKTRAESGALVADARAYFQTMGSPPASMPSLSAFAGLAKFPVRRACARLAWDALAAALG